MYEDKLIMKAVVIGNGKSRLNLKLDPFRTAGITSYGCNALYRDWLPDHLIAVNLPMLKEIISAGIHKQIPVYTYYNPEFEIAIAPEDYNYLKFIEPSFGWSSGPSALHIAANSNFYDTIYIIGFDYNSATPYLNNVYADTPNYAGSNEPANYFHNWIAQTEQVIKAYPNINFIRIVDEFSYIGVASHFENYQLQSVDEVDI